MNNIFIDSNAALEHLQSQRMGDSASIFSTSPVVLDQNKDLVKEFAPSLDDEGFAKLIHSFDNFITALNDALQKKSIDRFLRTEIIRHIIGDSLILRYVQGLEQLDGDRSCTAVGVEFNYAVANWLYNMPWSKILPMTNQAQTVYREASFKGNLYGAMVDPAFWDRLGRHGKEYYEYRFWLALWKGLNKKLSRGTVLLGKDSPLVFETALQFARRGYSISKLPKIPAVHVKDDFLQIHEIGLLISSLVKDYLSASVPSVALSTVTHYFEKLTNKAVQSYQRRYLGYMQLLAQQTNYLHCLLSNMPDPALASACHKNKLPIIAFQHGVSREITNSNDLNQICKEEVIADLVLTYNEEAAQLANNNAFGYGAAISVGAPKELLRLSAGKSKCSYGVMYVSTSRPNLHVGPIASSAWGDYQKEKEEIKLVQEVFSKLHSKVLFKPYPTTKYYYDKTLLDSVIKEFINIEFDRRWQSLRNYANEADIIVTSRATSTVGWCLAIDRPLVLIDYPLQLPFKEDVVKLLKESLFYIDASTPDYYQQMLNLLRRPVASLVAEWKAKAKVRSCLIETYFFSNKGGRDAGMCSYHAIQTTLRSSYV